MNLGAAITILLSIVFPFLLCLAMVAFLVKVTWDKGSIAPSAWLLLFLCVITLIFMFLDVQKPRAGGANTACKSNLKNIGTALEIYSSENCGRFPHILEILTWGGRYMRAIPRCPTGPAPCSYTFSTNPARYTVNCTGKNYHKKSGIKTGYPQYSSNEGLIER